MLTNAAISVGWKYSSTSTLIIFRSMELRLLGASITASSALELPEDADGELEEVSYRAEHEFIPDLLEHISLTCKRNARSTPMVNP